MSKKSSSKNPVLKKITKNPPCPNMGKGGFLVEYHLSSLGVFQLEKERYE
ncbi:hypothetical protein PSKAS_13520 [Peribacillus sp. N1]